MIQFFTLAIRAYISAAYYEDKNIPEAKEGEMPLLNGIVEVSVGGSASTTLKQTISGNGIRYANSDESLVFWSKGDSALIMRNNSMNLEYTNCTARAEEGQN